jgi:hypothetical protein
MAAVQNKAAASAEVACLHTWQCRVCAVHPSLPPLAIAIPIEHMPPHITHCAEEDGSERPWQLLVVTRGGSSGSQAARIRVTVQQVLDHLSCDHGANEPHPGLEVRPL